MLIKSNLRIVKREVLIDIGHFSSTSIWSEIEKQLKEAVQAIDWPRGTGKFTIFPKIDSNGVVPIKYQFVNYLKNNGWSQETRISTAFGIGAGPLDATRPVTDSYSKPRLFAAEWETGNISSSHRSLNKMSMGIKKNILLGGSLVLPTRRLAQYLTQRVGNFEEIQPYFDCWKDVRCQEGILVVYAVEQDEESIDVARIPKGTDGRALK